MGIEQGVRVGYNKQRDCNATNTREVIRREGPGKHIEQDYRGNRWRECGEGKEGGINTDMPRARHPLGLSVGP